MAKISKIAEHSPLIDDERTTAALDFDESHDEEQRDDDRIRASGKSADTRQPQRAPNQGDAPGAEVMADEMDDDNSFDEDGQPTARDIEAIGGSDTTLPASELADIAGSDELDEAELADLEPVGMRESEALKERIAKHARDPNAFEPAEAEMQRELQKSQAGSKP